MSQQRKTLKKQKLRRKKIQVMKEELEMLLKHQNRCFKMDNAGHLFS